MADLLLASAGSVINNSPERKSPKEHTPPPPPTRVKKRKSRVDLVNCWEEEEEEKEKEVASRVRLVSRRCGSPRRGSAIRTRHFSQRKGKPWLARLAKSDWFRVGHLSVRAQLVTVLRPTSVSPRAARI